VALLESSIQSPNALHLSSSVSSTSELNERIKINSREKERIDRTVDMKTK